MKRSKKKEEYNHNYSAFRSLFGIFSLRLADSYERNLKELVPKSKIDP